MSVQYAILSDTEIFTLCKMYSLHHEMKKIQSVGRPLNGPLDSMRGSPYQGRGPYLRALFLDCDRIDL